MSLFSKLIFAFSISATAAMAAPKDFAPIREKLARHKVVEGKFKQVRTIKDMDLHLESEGTFRFEQPLNLNWVQSKPFDLKLTMSPDRIVQKSFDGSEQVITKEQQPSVFVFSASFLEVFSGNEESLKKNFTTEVTVQGDKWQISLVPRDELLKKAIAAVEIRGAEFVSRVRVQEKNGNATEIEFTGVKAK
ncbi:MAG TPA: outer membrane lipoprotein carrier protein LolA [Bdellovibrionota bacterium]|jgi:hypothetical protein|nr:outer membrane lipoprotein carrier protein LolA [Bdellovibrionota bacterium]